jgi:hypothetical protein
VRPFGFGNRTFDDHVIDLSVIVSLLPFVVGVSVGASGNGENCAVGGEVVSLLRRLADLQRKWWSWIGFWLVLLVSVFRHWIVICETGGGYVMC